MGVYRGHIGNNGKNGNCRDYRGYIGVMVLIRPQTVNPKKEDTPKPEPSEELSPPPSLQPPGAFSKLREICRLGCEEGTYI